MSQAGAPPATEVENRPLTAIRGVASLWVVGHHWLPAASQQLRWLFDPGFTAVDLFFVLSGLILTRVHPHLPLSRLPDFYLRRIFRLYPLHLACLAWLVGIVAAQHGLASIDWLTLSASAALIHPFLDIAPIANPPSWSIGIELGCYLAFPVLLAALGRLRQAASATLAVLALLCLDWVIQFRLLGATQGAGAMARGLCGFGLGMAISVWRETLLPAGPGRGMRRSGQRLLGTGLELVGVAGIAWSLHAYRWGVIPPSAAVLLSGLALDCGPVARLLRHPLWVWLGRISFSMYLVHYPLLLCGLAVLDPTTLGRGGQSLWYAGLLALLLGLSTLTWRWIEQPMRRVPRRLRRRFGLATAAA